MNIFSGIGVGWHNLFLEGDINYKSVGSLGATLIFSIFGILFHFLLALYASALFPGKYGVPKHPLYFLRVNLFFNFLELNLEDKIKYFFLILVLEIKI